MEEHEISINKDVGMKMLRLLTEAILSTTEVSYPVKVKVNTPRAKRVILVKA
jgi:hypothetical protein